MLAQDFCFLVNISKRFLGRLSRPWIRTELFAFGKALSSSETWTRVGQVGKRKKTLGGLAAVAVRDGANSHQGSSTCGSNKYLGSVCSLLFLQIQHRSMILQNTIKNEEVEK